MSQTHRHFTCTRTPFVLSECKTHPQTPLAHRISRLRTVFEARNDAWGGLLQILSSLSPT